MCISALIGLGSAAVGAVGARNASRRQERAGNQQVQLARNVYNRQSRNFRPFLQGGTGAYNALLSELGLGDAPEGYGGYEMSPAANALLTEGVGNIEAGAAGRGDLFSGATLESLERLRGDIVGRDRDNYLNRLAGVASQGQAAAGQQAGAGQAFVNSGSNALANIGNAQAAGTVGVANALTQGLNTGLEFYNYRQNLNPLTNYPGSASPF